MKWTATYTYDKALPGWQITVEVDAPDEDTAKMRAGMARAETKASKFTESFYSRRVNWERTSIVSHDF